jgi:hypothetical protein
MTTLEDIRVGDIVLCPDGEEREVEQCANRLVHAGDDRWWDVDDLRNPEFRMGDTVRARNSSLHMPWDGTSARPHCFALVSRAAEKKPLIMSVWTMNSDSAVDRWFLGGDVPVRLATVKPDGRGWLSCFDGTESVFASERGAKKHADEWLAREGWVSEDAPLAEKRAVLRASGWVLGVDEAVPGSGKTVVYDALDNGPLIPPCIDFEFRFKPRPANRCTLCGHPGSRHYAACEHNPEPKGTRISTLGWDQPQPIVVLCQNDEDVP